MFKFELFNGCTQLVVAEQTALCACVRVHVCVHVKECMCTCVICVDCRNGKEVRLECHYSSASFHISTY